MFFFAALESVSVREAPTGLPLGSVGYLQPGSVRVNTKKREKTRDLTAKTADSGTLTGDFCAAHTRIAPPRACQPQSIPELPHGCRDRRRF
jgi:hypothetical protein